MLIGALTAIVAVVGDAVVEAESAFGAKRSEKPSPPPLESDLNEIKIKFASVAMGAIDFEPQDLSRSGCKLS